MEQHLYSLERSKTEYCGDHYCTGHTSQTMKCTCGWETKSDYRPALFKNWEAHKTSVINEKLNLEFGAADAK